MTSIAVELNEAFSEPGATARPWAEVADVLSASEMFWLSTTRRDGRPHVTPLPAIWADGALHFCTGDAEQKARNLLADPRCVLTTGANQYRSGLDLVVEGTAVRVTGQALASDGRTLDFFCEETPAAFGAGAGRRSGEDQVAGMQRHVDRQLLDLLGE